MRNLLLGFAIAAAIAPAAAFSAQQFTLDEARARIERLEARVAALEASGSAQSHVLKGSLMLNRQGNYRLVGSELDNEQACAGAGDFSVVKENVVVTVSQGDGKTLGQTILSRGTTLGLDAGCLFQFAASVPIAGSYYVTVGSHMSDGFGLGEVVDDWYLVTSLDVARPE